MNDLDIFATTMLHGPLNARTEAERRNARLRICNVCDQPVFRDNPLQVADRTRPDGHDPDCRGLEIWFNGFNGAGGGGGAGTAVTLGRSDITLSNAGITLGTLTD